MAERPDFDDRSQWEVYEGINVFDTHTRTLHDKKSGKSRTIKFDRKKLERIARNSNERDRIGQCCPLMIGHTKEGGDEEEQPDIVGYARKFTVAYDEKLGRPVVRCSYYLRKEDAARAKKFPRTSVEVWPDDDFFDPISLLKRTPQRDLGQWTYGKGGRLKLRYSMDDFDDRDDDGRGDAPPPGRGDDAPPPREDGPPGDDGYDGPEGVDPDFHGQFMKCMKHYESNKVRGAMGDGGDLPDAPPRRPKPVPREQEASRMRRDSESLRMARVEKMVADVARRTDAAIAGLQAENQSLRYDREAAVCERMVSELEAAGYHLNRAVEVERMADMDEGARERHVQYIRDHYNRAPVSRGRDDRDDDVRRAVASKPVRLSKSPPDRRGDSRVVVKGGSEGGRSREPEVMDDDETAEVLEYVRAHDLHGEAGWAQAVKAVRNGRGS